MTTSRRRARRTPHTRLTVPDLRARPPHGRSGGPPGTRTLRASDPAELLAMVTEMLGEVPRDSLALIGHDHLRTSPVSARADLPPLLAAPDRAPLGALFARLEVLGCTGAFALVVLGDGRGDPGDPACGEQAGSGLPIGVRGFAVRILVEAALRPRAAFEVPEVWVLAGGDARCVRLLPDPDGGQDGVLLAVGPPVPLAAPDSTLVAAEAVLAGVPRTGGADAADPRIGRLRALLLTGSGPEPVRGPQEPIAIAWRGARRALETAEMTNHDAIERFVALLASDRRRDEFADLVLARGRPAAAGAGRDVLEVVTDPRCIPHPSIRAGGAWYEAIATVLAITRPPRPARDGERWETLTAGWVNLASVLALCQWWNHRSATAGRLLDEVLELDPGHNLARLIALMADGAIAPGWRPGPSSRA